MMQATDLGKGDDLPVPRQNLVRRTNLRIFGGMMLSFAYTQDGVLVGRRGFDEGQMRLVIPPGQRQELQPRPDAALIKALTRAHRWKQRLFTGAAPSTSAISKEEAVTERYVSRIMRLAFLAPDIVKAILDGYQPAHLELERLLKGIPISWDAQRRVLGFSRG